VSNKIDKSKYSNLKGKLKFIDLFAGIGGFHIALNNIYNSECVLASEIDKFAADVYRTNLGITPEGDISQIKLNEIPNFDLLCAGFPCQPFSKGGNQQGFLDQTRGTLFFEILRILKSKKPKYLLLENVQNIVSHDNGYTYKIITENLRELGYSLPENPIILSPHQFGVPVNRPRLFIPGILKKELSSLKFDFPEATPLHNNYINQYFDFQIDDSAELQITDYEFKLLTMWDEFYKGVDLKIIGFPIWFEFFKSKTSLRTHPEWKQKIIKKNREFYIRNKQFIDTWSKKYDKLKWITNVSHKRFEWQCGDIYNGVFEGLIQIRPSGVRVKKMNMFSTLVAMNHPQIIGPLKRRLSIQETLLLQSFPSDFKMNSSRNISLKQLGNSVNVNVVQYVLNWLLTYEKRKH
jgi:DNA (cytosine-5)-methyltransferase 1